MFLYYLQLQILFVTVISASCISGTLKNIQCGFSRCSCNHPIITVSQKQYLGHHKHEGYPAQTLRNIRFISISFLRQCPHHAAEILTTLEPANSRNESVSPFPIVLYHVVICVSFKRLPSTVTATSMKLTPETSYLPLLNLLYLVPCFTPLDCHYELYHSGLCKLLYHSFGLQ